MVRCHSANEQANNINKSEPSRENPRKQLHADQASRNESPKLKSGVIATVEAFIPDFLEGQADLQEGLQPPGNRSFGPLELPLFP
jgi:hypothetical protein